MRKFFTKITFFVLVPLAIVAFLEIILPSTLFTHRPWESLAFKTQVPSRMYFYPNAKSGMIATGDLCHHTIFSIRKKEFWITDKLGFRNNEFVEKADILIIGDSFMAGSTLTQDDLLSNKLINLTQNKYKVYCMAPSSFTRFDYYFNLGFIKKPKLIIFSKVERENPEPISLYLPSTRNKLDDKFIRVFELGKLNVAIDKIFKFLPFQWLYARIHNSKGGGIQSAINPHMFFFQGNTQKIRTDEDLQINARTIGSYKKYCDSLGIEFLYVPMPNKETVYYDLVPFNKQPDYLLRLDSILLSLNISTVNTLKIYNNFRKSDTALLYHLDDTHWNSKATALISKAIMNTVSCDSVLIHNKPGI
jgi:alginate O-acetyltransferase complex protein AlgJ